jgi:hypothetical protein
MDGFKEAVQAAWNAYHRASDPCKTLDRKLRAVARALRSWRDTSIGSIRLRLAAARAIIVEFDTAQEFRPLSVQERDLRRELQHAVLGLASLSRTMARQRARNRQLAEGDACTRFFHLQACHRRRKNYLFALQHDGQTFTEEDIKADIAFDYYDGLLGTTFARAHLIDLTQLDLPRLDLTEQSSAPRRTTGYQVLSVEPRTRSGWSWTFLLHGGLGGRGRRHCQGLPCAMGRGLQKLPPIE